MTVGQKMGRRLWEWGAMEPRGRWKGPEHGCEARQGHGAAVGWGELGGCGMGSMGRQWEGDMGRLWDGGIGWLWDWEGTAGLREERGHCVSGTRHGHGVARLPGRGREPCLEALGKQLCGTGRRMAGPRGRTDSEPKCLCGAAPPCPNSSPCPNPRRGTRPKTCSQSEGRRAVTSAVTRQTPVRRVPFGTCPLAGQCPLPPDSGDRE